MCAKGDLCDMEERSHDHSCDSSETIENLHDTRIIQSSAPTQEIIIRPQLPVSRGPRQRTSGEIENRKEGDFETKRLIDNRMRELGLFESKQLLEHTLLQKLKKDIDRDGLFKAINACKRKRPLRERVCSVTDEIINIIQPRIVKDSYGNKLAFKVHIMMGIYTHNVLHKVSGHEVFIQGTTPERCGCAKLVKEIRIQFPKGVDMTRLRGTFSAGIFKCDAPFNSKGAQLRSRSLSSLSSYSEDSSLSSDQFKSHDIPAIEANY